MEQNSQGREGGLQGFLSGAKVPEPCASTAAFPRRGCDSVVGAGTCLRPCCTLLWGGRCDAKNSEGQRPLLSLQSCLTMPRTPYEHHWRLSEWCVGGVCLACVCPGHCYRGLWHPPSALKLEGRTTAVARARMPSGVLVARVAEKPNVQVWMRFRHHSHWRYRINSGPRPKYEGPNMKILERPFHNILRTWILLLGHLPSI